MGHHVRRFAGYGLTDLEKDDPRVNWGSPLLYDVPRASDYRRWLADRPAGGRRYPSSDQLYLRDASDDRVTLLTCVAWNREYGLPNVIAVRPVCQTGWYRSDDTLDWLAETYPTGEPMGNRVQVLPNGIHPWNGLYMDALTGEDLPFGVIEWIRARNYVRPGADPGIAATALDQAAAEFTPFASHAEAQARIVPRVPVDVRDLTEFGRLFTSPTEWRQLRPVSYTWWS